MRRMRTRRREPLSRYGAGRNCLDRGRNRAKMRRGKGLIEWAGRAGCRFCHCHRDRLTRAYYADRHGDKPTKVQYADRSVRLVTSSTELGGRAWATTFSASTTITGGKMR